MKSPIEEALDTAQDQLDAALQLVACLVLTSEEVNAAHPDAHPGNLDNWASSMQKELLSEDYRPQLVAMLQRREFPTNTHPGFPLGVLDAPEPFDYLSALNDLEELVAAYIRGEIPDPPDFKFEPLVMDFLSQKGHEPGVAQYAARRGCQLLLSARIERL